MFGLYIWKFCYCVFFYSWDVSILFSYCDGKCYIVIIIRKNQYVFGGYYDIFWGMYVINKMFYLFNCVVYSKW